MKPCERSVYFSKFMIALSRPRPGAGHAVDDACQNHPIGIWVLADMTQEGRTPADSRRLVFRIFRRFGDGRGTHLALRLMLVALRVRFLSVAGIPLRLAVKTIRCRPVSGLVIGRLAASLAAAGLAASALVISPLGAINLTVAAHLLRPRPIGIAVGIDRTVVVLGVLEIVLHGDAITGQARVTRQRQIFLHDLVGIAPHPHIGSGAVVVLWPRRVMRLAGATPARPPGIRTLSHARSHCSLTGNPVFRTRHAFPRVPQDRL